MPTRPATGDDLPAIAEIHRHYVATSVASVELHRRFGFAYAGCLTRVGYKHDR